MDAKQFKEQIKKYGRVSLNAASFAQTSALRFGAAKQHDASSTVAARLTTANRPPPQSTFLTTGEAPPGFGKQVNWADADAELALVIFINPADPTGVMISGVKGSDSIEFVSATGIASFAEGTENKGVASLIGIVAAGASLTATVFGAPEILPLINAANAFAQDQFKEQNVKTKRRDPFGQDPGTGNRARQEGGVLLSLPGAGQGFYSGDGDHKERWIKEPGTRDPAHYPAHVSPPFGHFLASGTDRITSPTDGDLLIYAWDHIFEDNFGFYRLHVLLKRGPGLPVPVVT